MNKINLISPFKAVLIITCFASIGWGNVRIVSSSELSSDCVKIGLFEGNAGFGKSLNGQQIALYRAKEAASEDGANYAVIVELNRGNTDQGGYCRLVGYNCPSSN